MSAVVCLLHLQILARPRPGKRDLSCAHGGFGGPPRLLPLFTLAQVEIFLKSYLLFLSRAHSEVNSFGSLKALLTASRSGDGSCSQFEFIELFLLGKLTAQGRGSTQLVPPTETNRGDLLSYLVKSQLFGSSYFAGCSQVPQDDHLVEAIQSLYATSLINCGDVGRQTRSRAPFLATPPPHQCDKEGFQTRLSDAERELISLVRSQTQVCQVCSL
jgi:hypothetical protein